MAVWPSRSSHGRRAYANDLYRIEVDVTAVVGAKFSCPRLLRATSAARCRRRLGSLCASWSWSVSADLEGARQAETAMHLVSGIAVQV